MGGVAEGPQRCPPRTAVPGEYYFCTPRLWLVYARRQGQKLNTLPKVAILMCTCNGQRFLAKQLDSFASQTYQNWEVWVSDDNSQDETLAIIEAYRQKWHPERLFTSFGPGKGFVANFLSLACRDGIEADYYAYSDQDDIWEAEKLERAIRRLEGVPKHTPALYCSRSRLIDAEGAEIGLSPLFPKPPGFANALVQSIAGGNSMVFNKAARELIRQAGASVPVVVHDWWTYMVVTGCGGKVFYDKHPTLDYRQHDANQIGMNISWLARFVRLRMVWEGNLKCWNDGNIAALKTLWDRLTPENREILERFAKARKMSFLWRLVYLRRSGVYRQTMLGNVSLVAAAIFKKI